MEIDITIPHPEKWPYWAKLGDLKPFQGSLKQLPPDNFERLKKQILEGFAFPIYVWVNDGNHYIIDGHQRTATLIRLRDQGYEVPDLPIVPVKAKDYNEAKIRVLQAASQYGKVDKEGYLDFIKDIDVDGFDLNFDLPDVDFDLDLPSEDESEGTEGNTDPDEVPEVDDNPYGVERGDVWLLGDHRLKCGDSTDESDVADLMDGEKIDLLITDLPYGVSYADKNNFLNSK